MKKEENGMQRTATETKENDTDDTKMNRHLVNAKYCNKLFFRYGETNAITNHDTILFSFEKC